MAITHVALDDSKRVIVAGILRPEATQPELREIPNDPHIRRLFERLLHAGPVHACYEAGGPATISIANSPHWASTVSSSLRP